LNEEMVFSKNVIRVDIQDASRMVAREQDSSASGRKTRLVRRWRCQSRARGRGGSDRKNEAQGQTVMMNRLNTPPAGSANADPARPAACLLQAQDRSGGESAEAVEGNSPGAGLGSSAHSTHDLAASVFAVLHRALHAAKRGEGGARFDSLVGSLQVLFDQCDELARQLEEVVHKHDAHPLAQRIARQEAHRASTVADAVHAVMVFVRGRALGELDRGDLNSAWLRLREDLALRYRAGGARRSPSA